MAELDPGKHALTPLMIAAADGDMGAVQQILESGAVVNARDNRGGTALMYAVMNQHVNIVRLLLNAGADPRLKTHRGLSAISIAENKHFQELLHILKAWAYRNNDTEPKATIPKGPPQRVHTYYDNLKVARDAPIEVVRAAYRSLSQKYHPDRNPKNAEAARIMSLLNRAYEVLSDPAKRRDHNQWIVQSEMSTPPTDGADDGAKHQAYSDNDDLSPNSNAASGVVGTQFGSHMRRWWAVYLVGAAAIWAATRTSPTMTQAPAENPVSVPQSTEAPAPPTSNQASPYGTQPKAAERPVMADGGELWEPAEQVQKNDAGEYRALIGGEWHSVVRAQKNDAEGTYRIQRLASTQPKAAPKFNLANSVPVEDAPAPGKAPPLSPSVDWADFKPIERARPAIPFSPLSSQQRLGSYKPSAYSRPSTDPNGNPWPVNSGYINGYSRLLTNGYSSVTVDNSQNDSDVFVKIFALNNSPPNAVRTFFIRARSQFTIGNVRAGSYDVRYQDLDSGARAKSESFELEELHSDTGVRFSRLTMTLYKVAHGNMRTYPISDNEFQ